MTQQGGPATYHHGDLIRSTMLQTDESGAANQMAAYTAFGEMVRPSGTIGYDPNAALPTRYQYAGGWGYESGVISLYGANPNLPPVTLMHVGARWYQPDIGRFVQRDPIGIRGGINVYAYCRNVPTMCFDPTGYYAMDPDGDWIKGIGALIAAAGAVVSRFYPPVGVPMTILGIGVTNYDNLWALGLEGSENTAACIIWMMNNLTDNPTAPQVPEREPPQIGPDHDPNRPWLRPPPDTKPKWKWF